MKVYNLPKIIFGLVALVLALDPIKWLVNTWLDPSYDSRSIPIVYWALNIYQPYKYETSLSTYRLTSSTKIPFSKPEHTGGQNTIVGLPLTLVCSSKFN